jgi:hypothetical protein
MPDGSDDGPTRGMWRLELSGSATTVAIDEVAYLNVPVAQNPMPALGAQYMAIAYANGELRTVVPVAFATRAIGEAGGSNGIGGTPTPVALPDAVASVFIDADPDVDHIDIIDSTGATRASTTELPRAARAKSTYLRGHVRVLGADELSLLPSALRPGILPSTTTTAEAVDDPTPAMLAALDADLGLLGPNVLDAVQTVAVVKLHNTGEDPKTHLVTLGVAWGSTFIVNERYFTDGWSLDELATVMVHEAAHSYTFLLDYAGSWTTFWSDWPSDIRQRALALCDRYRLGAGLAAFFEHLQATGQSAGIAGGYTGDAWQSSSAVAVAAGFATDYGSTNSMEDIAEVTASVQYPSGMGRNAEFCPQLRSYGPQLLDKNAMPYVKAKLLATLGFIDPAKLDTCVLGIAVSRGPGLHFGVSADGDELDLASGTVGTTNDSGPHEVVTATGADGHIVTMHFRSDVANGVGLHRLDATAAMPNPDGDSIEITGPVSGDHRRSGSGLLIVTAADPAKAEGLVFFLEEDNDFNFPTDVFAFSTFQIP